MHKKKMLLSVISLMLCALLAFSACDGGKKDKEDKNEKTSSLSGDVITDAGNENQNDITESVTTNQPVKPSTEKLIALTYDDGPNPSTTNRILTALEENNSVATFFIVGNRIDSSTETIQRAIDMGCEIANHTNSHKYLNEISDSERSNQINNVNSKMESDFGYDVKLLRAPGGKYKGVTDSVGMPLIQWSIDTNDWRHKDTSKPRSEEQRQKEMDDIIDDVMSSVKSGDIILMHDIYDFTADMSEILIPKLVAAGYKLVTVSEMYEAYGQTLEAGEVYFNCYIKEVIHAVEPIPAGEYYVKTENGGGLNLRADATTSSNILVEIPDKTELTVTEAIKGWAKVRIYGIFKMVQVTHSAQSSSPPGGTEALSPANRGSRHLAQPSILCQQLQGQ